MGNTATPEIAPRRRIPIGVLLVIGCCTGFSVEGEAQPAEPDWLIVPGERVGPITAGTSEEMLKSLFGPENVLPRDVYVGEGFSEPGTSIFPDDATQHLEIVWRDDTRTTIDWIRLRGESTKWHTAESISLGTTLKELEDLNGFPFRLVGFAFDYAGGITNCGRGRLRMLGCTDDSGNRLGRSIGLSLSPSIDARAMPEYGQVLGDNEYSSGHPAMQALNPAVYQIVVTFPAVE